MDGEIKGNEQHIYHHYDNDGVRITVKAERNSRGVNYEASVSGAKTVEEAMSALKSAQQELELTYGTANNMAKE